ncbi:MAG TPA: cytochrome C oxidase subunit IV family protein [Candidatus Saccharimonadales bacterium]
MKDIKKEVQVSYRNYLIGFTLSLMTTFIAYFAVTESWLQGWGLLVGLALLAFTQMIVQLYLFLHLGEELKPRLRAWSFVFMSVILFIVVAGSLWIMAHLDYNMMHMNADEKTHYMMGEKDKGF